MSEYNRDKLNNGERTITYELSKKKTGKNDSKEISIDDLSNITGGESQIVCHATGDSHRGPDWICDL